MTPASARHVGKVFDEISASYDRHRPGYPDALIDQACKIAGLEDGDKIIEIGCGSGQLTRSLTARGYHVTAVEPGKNLITLAEKNSRALGKIEFINARFEDAVLPKRQFKAVFSASAFHWIDPDISWQKTADLLVPGGTLGLIQYFGLKEKRTELDLQMQIASLKKIDPKVAASWPRYYELDEILVGVEKRRGNVSDVWSWLGGYDLARDYAGQLFIDVQLAALPKLIEQTADQLIGLIRTLSFYSRLSKVQRSDLARELKKIEAKLGRPMRSSTACTLISARRAPIYRSTKVRA